VTRGTGPQRTYEGRETLGHPGSLREGLKKSNKRAVWKSKTGRPGRFLTGLKPGRE